MRKNNWNEYYKKATGKYSLNKFFSFDKDYWNRSWLRKKESIKPDYNDDFVQNLLDLLEVTNKESVLDIGSGNGRVSIPLGAKAGQLTAVDISDIALNQLIDNSEKQKVDNITVLNKKWEDVEIGQDLNPHDVTLMSHIYVLRNLQESLLKMDILTKKRAYVVEAINPKVWTHPVLWERLFHRKFTARPDYIVTVNILYQLGINAGIKIWEYQMKQVFRTLDDAVDLYFSKYRLSDSKSKKIIENYLGEILKERDNKYYIHQKQKAVLIYWEK